MRANEWRVYVGGGASTRDTALISIVRELEDFPRAAGCRDITVAVVCSSCEHATLQTSVTDDTLAS